MALHEFRCNNCELLYEAITNKNKPWGQCPECGDVKTVHEISRGSFKLKGQCWAENGYMRGEK